MSSLNELIRDEYKPWLNARVNNLTVDGSLNIIDHGQTVTLNGLWVGLLLSSTKPAQVVLNKIGRNVFIWIKGVIDTGATPGGSQTVLNVPIPTAFLPEITGSPSATAIALSIPVVVNNNQNNTGKILLDFLSAEISINFNTPASGTNNGWFNLSGCYRSAT